MLFIFLSFWINQDFAAMDAAYPADWQEANNVIHLPVVGQAIVIAYNLAGSPAGVNDTLVITYHEDISISPYISST
jgi:ABC-type phosphate transport system substrate-binding protein